MRHFRNEIRQAFEEVIWDSEGERASDEVVQELIEKQLSDRLGGPMGQSLHQPESRWAKRNPLLSILSGQGVRAHLKDVFWDGLATLVASAMLFYGLTLYGFGMAVALGASLAPFALYGLFLGITALRADFSKEVSERLETTHSALRSFSRDQRRLQKAFAKPADDGDDTAARAARHDAVTSLSHQAAKIIDEEADALAAAGQQQPSRVMRASKAMHFTGIGLVLGSLLAIASASPFLTSLLYPDQAGVIETVSLFSGAAIAPWPMLHAALAFGCFALLSAVAGSRFEAVRADLNKAVTALFADGKLLDRQSAAHYTVKAERSAFWQKELGTAAEKPAQASESLSTTDELSHEMTFSANGKRIGAARYGAMNKLRFAPITDQERTSRLPRAVWCP